MYPIVARLSTTTRRCTPCLADLTRSNLERVIGFEPTTLCLASINPGIQLPTIEHCSPFISLHFLRVGLASNTIVYLHLHVHSSASRWKRQVELSISASFYTQ